MGFSGLVLAAVAAATMSTLSTNLNSAATAITTDFYTRLFRGRNPLKCGRVVTFLTGIIGGALALVLANIEVGLIYNQFLIYSLSAALVPERDVRFFDLPNVKGMKYTGRDYYAAQALKRRIGKETIWFAGCDEQLVCALALGNVFSGGIGTTYNIIPGHFAKICRLAFSGKFREAAKIQDEANKVVELMIESDNWSYRKAMMKYAGIDCGFYPGPFEPLTPTEEKAFLKRFAALGIVKPGQAHARRG